MATMQTFRIGSVQSVLAMHSTHVPEASSQNGVGFGHGVCDEHAAGVGIGFVGAGFGGGGDGAPDASKSMSPVSRVVQPTTTIVKRAEHVVAHDVRRRDRRSQRRITSEPTSMNR
jgi:hypothetical protein